MRVYALRILFMDKILRFTNTFIIIIIDPCVYVCVYPCAYVCVQITVSA